MAPSRSHTMLAWRPGRITRRVAPDDGGQRSSGPDADGQQQPAPSVEEPLPLVTQLEGDNETFVTSAGVVEDVEEEDARVRCRAQ